MKRSSHLTFFISQIVMLVMFIVAPASVRSETIHIKNIEQLQKIGDNDSYPLNGIYVLDNDTDASVTWTWDNATGTPKGFRPIGTIDSPFTGSLDGKGFKISHVYINRVDAEYVGLFGYVSGNPATIKNIGLDNATITGNSFTGALVGYTDNYFIYQCYSTGSVSGTEYVGGLVGMVGRSNIFTPIYIKNCYSKSSVNGNYYIGGLMGWNDNTTISQCYSAGKVSDGEGFSGGLIGYGTIATVSACFWDSSTSGQSTSAGGTAKSTADMYKQSTFTNAGWDFKSVWGISDSKDYPFLRNIKSIILSPKPDEYHTSRNHELRVTSPGVLGNDRDPSDNRTFTAIYSKKPSKGTFEGTAEGAFIYNPYHVSSTAKYTDNFTYKVQAGDDNSSEVYVTLFIDNTTTAPVGVSDSFIDYCTYKELQDIYTGFYTDNPDVEKYTRELIVSAPGVLLNDVGDSKTAELLTETKHGLVVLNPDGSFTYIPRRGFLGVDSFTYTVINGTLFSSPTVVEIAVNPKYPDDQECPKKLNCPVEELYGKNSSEATTLRRYRDEVLATSAAGRTGIKYYYRIAPVAAGIVKNSERMQRMTKAIINLSLPGIRERLQKGQ